MMLEYQVIAGIKLKTEGLLARVCAGGRKTRRKLCHHATVPLYGCPQENDPQNGKCFSCRKSLARARIVSVPASRNHTVDVIHRVQNKDFRFDIPKGANARLT